MPRMKVPQKFRAVQHRAQMMARGLGEAIKRRRQALQLDPVTIGGQTDMEPALVGLVESGGSDLSFEAFCALVVALDCRLELVEINDRGK